MRSSKSSSLRSASPLPRSFYLRDTIRVAKDLLGKALVVRSSKQTLVAGILTEVEAYLGSNDPAAHSYRGKTPRTWPMFEAGGTCYVYLSYGINYCMNVATHRAGIGEAVLFRAMEPIEGHAAMARRRKITDFRLDSPRACQKLMSGPGKLTQALGIDLDYNGTRFDRAEFKLVDLGNPRPKIGSSPRIGISQAKQRLLRFFIRDSPWLSRNLPSSE